MNIFTNKCPKCNSSKNVKLTVNDWNKSLNYCIKCKIEYEDYIKSSK